MRRRPLVKLLLAALALVAGACGDDDSGDGAGSLVVYSGRTEELVAPVIEMFEDETGIEVEVRYGDTAEMAAQILEEGDNSPAGVFFGQDAGALGALSSEGRFVGLPDEVLELVDDAYRSAEGEWVGVSGRSRVVVYNKEALAAEDLPDSILDFTDPVWSGRLGWAPTNGSFQAFVTALRVLVGEDEARAWLEGIAANDVAEYANNIQIVEATAAGEIDAGFVNHYYLHRYLADDPDYPAAYKLYGGGDPGGLVNVAGVGILDDTAEARRFVEFLLSEQAQSYFAEETYEIPLVAGVEPVEGVPTFDELTTPDIDLDQLEDLDGTVTLLTEVGIL